MLWTVRLARLFIEASSLVGVTLDDITSDAQTKETLLNLTRDIIEEFGNEDRLTVDVQNQHKYSPTVTFRVLTDLIRETMSEEVKAIYYSQLHLFIKEPQYLETMIGQIVDDLENSRALSWKKEAIFTAIIDPSSAKVQSMLIADSNLKSNYQIMIYSMYVQVIQYMS